MYPRTWRDLGGPLQVLDMASDDDDDLPDFSLGRPLIKRKVVNDNCSVLANILQQRRKDKEKDSHIKEVRQQILQFKDKIENDEKAEENHILVNNCLSLNSLIVNESTILERHKGETIIDVTRRYCFFDEKTLHLRDYSEADTSMDKLLQSLTAEELVELVKINEIFFSFRKITNKGTVIRYLYQLLSVHSDFFVVNVCYTQLHQLLFANSEFANSISLEDIIKILLNYGADYTLLLPDAALRQRIDSRFSYNHKNRDPSTLQSSTLSAPEWDYFMHHFLEITFILLKNCSMWVDDDYVTLGVILCALVVDVHFATSPDVVILIKCLSLVVSKLSDSQWELKVFELSRHICHLSDDHHTLTFLVQLFYSSPRMEQLKRITAFCTIYKVLGMELPKEITFDVSPVSVVNFLQSCSLKGDVDLYLWYNILHLVNSCVSSEPRSVESKLLDELCFEMKRLSGSIKENLHCIDATKVKDLVTRICSKWSLLKSVAPVSQRTLFKYIVPESRVIEAHCENTDKTEILDDNTSTQDQLNSC